MRPRGLEVSQHRVSRAGWSSPRSRHRGRGCQDCPGTVHTASSPWTERSHKLFPLGGGPPQHHLDPLALSSGATCSHKPQVPQPHLCLPACFPIVPCILYMSHFCICLLFSGQTDGGQCLGPPAPPPCLPRHVCVVQEGLVTEL